QKHAAVLEALTPVYGAPQIGFRVIDIVRDHLARAEIQPELYGDQNDRKQNADERNRQTDAVMKQITKGKRQDHRSFPHGVGQGIGHTPTARLSPLVTLELGL